MKHKIKNHIRRVILLGRKKGAADALNWLIKRGIEVSVVVAPDTEVNQGLLGSVAKKHKLSLITNDADIYSFIERKDPRFSDIDLIISYLYPKKIHKPLYELAKKGCINFHPAPLPDYKGRAGYNTAIMENRETFGVSAHYIDSEKFDSGPIIKVLNFPIDSGLENAITLEEKSQLVLAELFQDVMSMFIVGKKIAVSPNTGGLYLTSKQLEEMKIVDLSKDSAEKISRTIRAFFFPPHQGAKISVNGVWYTLIDDSILKFLSSIVEKAKEKST
jgi:methionyl-tRNA formyltransferase